MVEFVKEPIKVVQMLQVFQYLVRLQASHGSIVITLLLMTLILQVFLKIFHMLVVVKYNHLVITSYETQNLMVP
jgi:hypothetical protein